jgi:hypothetical protein
VALEICLTGHGVAPSHDEKREDNTLRRKSTEISGNGRDISEIAMRGVSKTLTAFTTLLC